ncbi:MAG: hypothetical protein WC307_02535 [Candidatus Nanoarchaeia archaeon]|jgi:hypothetical protein
MNRKGSLLITIGIIAAVVVGGGIAANTYLESSFGIGVLDIINAVLTSGATLQDAQSLEDVKAEIGITSYNTLLGQKQLLDDAFGAIDISGVNANSDVTSLIKGALGNDYYIYMFSVATVGDLQFKVFEWSIGFTNGTVTDFTTGKIFSSYNVNVQFNNEAANDLINGNVTANKMSGWIKNGLIKINPILEVTRFINVLPQIISLVQANV